MSPVEMCGSAEVLAQALGLRALAGPGGPSRIRFSSDKTEAAYPLRAHADAAHAAAPRGGRRPSAARQGYFKKPS